MEEAIQLRYALTTARRAMLQTSSDDEIRHWCRLAATQIVAGCVALSGSEKHFQSRYPRQAIFLADAQHLVQEPSSHVGKLLPLFKAFGSWLARELERQRLPAT